MDQHFPQLARWDNAALVKCSNITDETRSLWARLSTAWQGRLTAQLNARRRPTIPE
jgi:hypothetical protein